MTKLDRETILLFASQHGLISCSSLIDAMILVKKQTRCGLQARGQEIQVPDESSMDKSSPAKSSLDIRSPGQKLTGQKLTEKVVSRTKVNSK